MKLCKDCDHFKAGTLLGQEFEFARCTLTDTKRDPVSGAFRLKHEELTYCGIIRKSTRADSCGPNAKFYRCAKCADLDGDYCSEECSKEATAEFAYLKDLPLSALVGGLSSEQEQDVRDAGRGHLVRS